MIIVWEGSKPPTLAERAALARAASSGQLKNGDRARPARANPAPPDTRRARKAFRRFHWGNAARGETRVRLPDFSALYALGELVAVEYETQKGGERAVWVHKFSKPRPTLTATPSGKLGPIVGGRAIVTERGIER